MASRGSASRFSRLLHDSTIPLLLVDGDRRYVDANTPACLVFRQSLSALRQLRIDDLTPRHFWPAMREAWERLIATGSVGGTYEVASPHDTQLTVVYYAAWGALPDLAVIAFVPAGWEMADFSRELGALEDRKLPALTPRELEVLELATEGNTAPKIAEELVVSPATVRTHFEHIYEKLGVRDRAAAVAKAMRLGLIA